MNCLVYILHSAKLDRFYIGFTSSPIETRLSKHLGDHKGFTAKAKDWKVVYTELFNTKAEAMKRERQLKAWKNNQRIKQLIEGSPTE